jgi:hypothetical protein
VKTEASEVVVDFSRTMMETVAVNPEFMTFVLVETMEVHNMAAAKAINIFFIKYQFHKNPCFSYKISSRMKTSLYFPT